jgi:hypothetical protein
VANEVPEFLTEGMPVSKLQETQDKSKAEQEEGNKKVGQSYKPESGNG